MKNLLAAMFVALLLAGCGSSEESVEDKIREAKESGATELALDFTGISDLTSLAGLSKLEYLGLYGNEITDVTPLKGLANLELLSLGDNQITDLTSLMGLTNLKLLNLTRNPIPEDQKEMIEKALPDCDIWF